MGHSYLSSKAETRVSEISGKGTYAVSNIAKNEMIAIFGGKVIDNDTWQKFEDKLGVLALPLDENFVIGPYSDEESGDGDYINHSCNPNSGIRGMRKLIAVKNITAGDEIVWDYSASDDSGWYHKCSCGAKNCRKIITPWRDLPASTKRKYTKLGIVSSWITKRDRSPNKH